MSSNTYQHQRSSRRKILAPIAFLRLIPFVNAKSHYSSFGLLPQQQDRSISHASVERLKHLWSAIPRAGIEGSAAAGKSEDLFDVGVLANGRGLNVRGGAVHHVKGTSDLESYFVSHPESLVIIDFTASWCGPCQMVAPYYEQLSEEFPDIVFLKVDVDECQDIAMKYDVSAMPTFLFLKQGEVVDRMMGANLPKLKEMMEDLS